MGWKPGADVGAIWRGFTSLGDRESRRAFLATTRAVIDFGGQSISAHDHLGAVTPPPTLIVWGSKDRMIPAWHALTAQRAVPDCRVELFEGAGHFPHLDDPERFARVLREFMTGPTGPPRPLVLEQREEERGDPRALEDDAVDVARLLPEAEPTEQPDPGVVAVDHDGRDPVEAEVVEAESEQRARGLGGVPLSRGGRGRTRSRAALAIRGPLEEHLPDHRAGRPHLDRKHQPLAGLVQRVCPSLAASVSAVAARSRTGQGT